MTTPTHRPALQALAALLVALIPVVSGCASAPPQVSLTAANSPPALPTQWLAPLPHQGELVQLNQWWQRFDDPLLTPLMQAAQAASPTLAAARTRVEEARATRVATGSALGPQLNAGVNAVRGRQDLLLPLGSSAAAGVQASWEIDVFGGGRAARSAAQARLAAAQAGWHDARVIVAAEVASSYLQLRACEALLVHAEADALSRTETARLTELAAKAGFQPPANAALTRASAAQGNSRWLALQTQCTLQLKTLVALTAIDEPTLREQLAAGRGRIAQPAGLAVSALPAEVLNQRPDLFIASQQLIAASAEVAQSRAARLPRLSLQGSIGMLRVQSGAGSAEGSTWSIGPVALTLPLWDGGSRAANVDAALARYDEAALVYRAQARVAVREVESALVQLHSAEARQEDARIAAEGYTASLRATTSRHKGGLASLFELEDARRSALIAQSAVIDLQLERVASWITLYRALGGGWSQADVQAQTRWAAPPVLAEGPVATSTAR